MSSSNKSWIDEFKSGEGGGDGEWVEMSSGNGEGEGVSLVRVLNER